MTVTHQSLVHFTLHPSLLLAPKFLSHMTPPLFPSSTFFLFLLLFISVNLPTSLAVDDDRFTNCVNTFSCGKVSNLKYPFWGGNRAQYCGLPDFQLKCEANIPNIIIRSITYRILDLQWTSQSLTVVREDYLQNLCPSDYKNNTFDPNLFKYGDGVTNVTLLYDCNSNFPKNQYVGEHCKRYDGTYTYVYYVGDLVYTSYCKTTVLMPVFGSQIVPPDHIPSAIDKGFGLQWMVNNEACDRCAKSGGECGYNETEAQFSCFCREGPQKPSCSQGSSSEKKSSSKGVKAGIAGGVSGAVCIIIVVCCVCFVVKRRKRIAEQSKSKDLFLPPSSRGAATSTTNTSESVPSYYTSRSESVQQSFFYGVKVFSYTELEEATKNFDPSMELGNGGFGTVYYGTLNDGRAVAVKRLYESNLKRVEQFKNEVEILARLRHRNLVELYGCTSRHSRELLLVYEYIPNGTVADHLHGTRAKSGLLPWSIRLNIAVETAEALAYLHKSDVIHRDVKTNNILLDNQFCVKVADFGLSRLFPNDVTHVSTAPQGTPGYVDPEYYQCYQLTDKSDVYSFGVVLIELISSLEAVDINRHRHEINLANMAVNKIQNHAVNELVDPFLGFERDNAIERMTTAVAELAFRCLQQDKDMRPSMDEVLEVLRGIQKEQCGGHEAEIVNIRTEEVMLLKNDDLPFSPDSVADNWVSTSTTSNSS